MVSAHLRESERIRHGFGGALGILARISARSRCMSSISSRKHTPSAARRRRNERSGHAEAAGRVEAISGRSTEPQAGKHGTRTLADAGRRQALERTIGFGLEQTVQRGIPARLREVQVVLRKREGVVVHVEAHVRIRTRGRSRRRSSDARVRTRSRGRCGAARSAFRTGRSAPRRTRPTSRSERGLPTMPG